MLFPESWGTTERGRAREKKPLFPFIVFYSFILKWLTLKITLVPNFMHYSCILKHVNTVFKG